MKILKMIGGYIVAVSIFHFSVWFILSFAMYDFSYFHFEQWNEVDRASYLVVVLTIGTFGIIPFIKD
jgi:hypothetical protein